MKALIDACNNLVSGPGSSYAYYVADQKYKELVNAGFHEDIAAKIAVGYGFIVMAPAREQDEILDILNLCFKQE